MFALPDAQDDLLDSVLQQGPPEPRAIPNFASSIGVYGGDGGPTTIPEDLVEDDDEDEEEDEDNDVPDYWKDQASFFPTQPTDVEEKLKKKKNFRPKKAYARANKLRSDIREKSAIDVEANR